MHEHLGQLFILGFSGKELPTQLRDFLGDKSIGGLILFEHNFDSRADLRRLIDDIHASAEIAPLVMIDQEVHGVNRITENMPVLTDNDLSEADTVSFRLRQAFVETAAALKKMGMDAQLAPVVDIGSADSPVLKGRCLGNDPERVAELAAISVEAIQSEGISACAKHFPGLGKAKQDPHLKLAHVNSSKEEWLRTDAVPFKKAISHNVHFVMTTHLVHSAVDDDSPATLSRKVIEDCLVKELGFKGLIITDDLTMKGITERCSVPDIALKALSAGHHLLLLCQDFETQKETLKSVRRAYERGVLDRERIDRAVVKVLDFKRRYVHT